MRRMIPTIQCCVIDRFTDPEKPSYKAVKELPWDKLEQGTKVIKPSLK